MIASFSLMMSVSSLFALFIGMFIIYNSFAIAVTRAPIGDRHPARPRRDARRRSGGCSSARALVIGLIGSAVGMVPASCWRGASPARSRPW